MAGDQTAVQGVPPGLTEESLAPSGVQGVPAGLTEEALPGASPVSGQPTPPQDSEWQAIDKGASRGVLKSFGIQPPDPNDPNSITLSNFVGQTLGNLGKSVQQAYKRWGGDTPATALGGAGTLAKGGAALMVAPDVLASGIEGLGTTLKDGSGDIYEGLKAGDHGRVAEGAGKVLGALGQLSAGADAAEEGGLVTKAGQGLEAGGLQRAGGLLRASSPKLYRYGKDPRAAIADEGIKPTQNLEGLRDQLQGAQDKIDGQMKSILNDPKVKANTIDASKIITQKYTDALNDVANQSGLKNRQAIIDGLNTLYKEATSKFDANGKVVGSIHGQQMAPADVLTLRRAIQRNTRYVPDPEINDYLNGAAKGIVGALGDAIDQSATAAGQESTRALSRRWANAIEAENLVNNRIAREGKTDTGVNNLLHHGEWGAALSTLVYGHPWLGASIALNRLWREPVTRIASARAGSAVGKVLQTPEAATASGVPQAAAVVSPAASQTAQTPAGWVQFMDSKGGVHSVSPENWPEVQKRDPEAKQVVTDAQ